MQNFPTKTHCNNKTKQNFVFTNFEKRKNFNFKFKFPKQFFFGEGNIEKIYLMQINNYYHTVEKTLLNQLQISFYQ